MAITNFYCIFVENLSLNLSWRRSLPYRNQFIDLQCKSMGWFLYDRNIRHERVKLLPLGKCFLVSFKNILPTFVLALRQYGRLNHMILRLLDLLLFVLVLVVFGINVMSWKPRFLSVPKYIGIDSLKTTSLEDMSLIKVEQWFDFL